MKGSEILAHVDHTLLSPTASWKEIQTLCGEAAKYRTASVCIPASYVGRVHDEYGDAVNICTVIGFPLGHDTRDTKIFAARKAISDGASEIDCVINIGDVKNGDLNRVRQEIAALKDTVKDKILKIIVETCYLTEDEKIAVCLAVTEGGADYIKTSTGFGTAGATHEDVLLMREHVGRGVLIKAAGGIRTTEDMKQYLAEGCDRLGCSAAVKLLKDKYDIEV